MKTNNTKIKSRIILALQLLGIFLTVRILALYTGVMFIRIPLVDDCLMIFIEFINGLGLETIFGDLMRSLNGIM